MKPQISFQTAFGKDSFNTFGNRRRGIKAQIGGIINQRTFAAVLCVSLLLTVFYWTGWQAVKADSSLGNVPTGSDPISVAVNPMTSQLPPPEAVACSFLP